MFIPISPRHRCSEPTIPAAGEGTGGMEERQAIKSQTSCKRIHEDRQLGFLLHPIGLPTPALFHPAALLR